MIGNMKLQVKLQEKLPQLFPNFHKVSFKRKYKSLFTGFQKILSNEETARKLNQNFLGHQTRRLYKRQVNLEDHLDVIIVLDSSSSVSKGEFARALIALQDLVKKLRNDTNYAAITYATRATTQFNFTNSFQTAKKLLALERSGGKTNTQDALKRCQEMFVGDQYGARQGSLRRILVVTDGQSNINRDQTVTRAFQLKLLGIEVFVIAVGQYLEGIQEMVQMASSTNAHMFRVLNMKNLVEVVKLIPNRGQKSWLEESFAGMTSEEDGEDAGPLRGRM